MDKLMLDLQFLIEAVLMDCRNIAQIEKDLAFWKRSAETDMRLFREKMTMLKGYDALAYDSLCAIISPTVEVTVDASFEVIGTIFLNE
jgi:hypothetical protein